MEYKNVPSSIKQLESNIFGLKHVAKEMNLSGPQLVNMYGIAVEVDANQLKAVLEATINLNNIELESLKKTHEVLTKAAAGLL